MNAPLPLVAPASGLRIGHYQRIGRGYATGTTVALFDGGATAGVDVRGGAPGTRETDLLRPGQLVQRIQAVCLTGGSAYGLAAADGVMAWLEERGMGFPVGAAPHEVVPIVPTAVIFDLGRGGRFAARPTAEFGHRAVTVAHADRGRAHTRAWRSGSIGAGTGARAGGLKGGVGSASAAVPGGTVTAVAVVNAAGMVVDPASGLPHHRPGSALRRPDRADLRRLREHLTATSPAPPTNTTIGFVATDVALTKTECTVLARAAHDGLARAVRPAHAMTDGDTIFGVSTGDDPVVDERTDAPFGGPAGRTAVMNPLLDAAAECFARACTAAVVDATTVGALVAYRDLCPSAFASPPPG